MLELSYSDSSSSQVKNHIAGQYSVIKDIYSVPSWINSALISQKKYRLMFIIMSFNHTDTAIETVLMNPGAPAFCQLCRRDPTCDLDFLRPPLLCLSRMLQGPYGSLDRDRPLIRLPFTSFAVGTVLLPLTGLIACLFISLVYHFEDATFTHCHVSRHKCWF